MKRSFAFAGALALALSASLAGADETAADAKAHYDKGVVLTDDGAFDAALVEFERAYALHPSFRILYNIGLIHNQLHDYAASLRAFLRYLAEGGAEVPADRRTSVEAQIVELRTRVATVTLVASVDGADLVVDDVLVGRSPLAEPLIVNSGHHVVTATKGAKTITKRITLAARDEVRVELALPVDAPVADVVTPPAPKIPWIPWAVTAGLTGGAIVTGVLALRASTTLADERRTDGISRAELDAQQSKTKNLALATDLLTGGAIVAAGVSVYLTVVALGGPRKEHVDDAANATDAPVVHFALGPGSLALFGSF